MIIQPCPKLDAGAKHGLFEIGAGIKKLQKLNPQFCVQGANGSARGTGTVLLPGFAISLIEKPGNKTAPVP